MAFGLPVEGEEGPFAVEALTEVATCGPDEPAPDVARRLDGAGANRVVVVNDAGIVLGLAERAALSGAGADDPVAGVMALSPTTVRPSVPLSEVSGDEPTLVTDSAGRLLGAVMPATGSGDDRLQQLQGTFLDLASAIEEHFGGREPSEAEVRGFLRDRLTAEGRSPAEADRFLEEMDQTSG